jgi:glucose/arabinose dehydrogenase
MGRLTVRPASGARRAVATALTAAALLAGCRQQQASRSPAAGGPPPMVVPLATGSGRTHASGALALGTGTPSQPGIGATPGPTAGQPDPAAVRLQLSPGVSGLEHPVDVKPAGPRLGRLAVVEKAGRVRLVADGNLAPGAWLDIRSRVGSSGSEQGLLGLAFHPGFGQVPGERRFYVNYTDRGGDTVVAEYRVSDNPDQADPASGRTVLTVHQPAANHNGGDLAFGPDGDLYIGLGDGGGTGDPYHNARNPGSWLGKVLRVDVDAGAPYAVPADNPFVGVAGWRPEIWAWGLRNPWKLSFDRATGDLYIADVGQADWEEVDYQPAGAAGGADYGWPVLEGNHCYGDSGAACAAAGSTVRPVAEYSHADGNCAVTGGYVYRGRAIPALAGAFVFGDYCSGRVWAAWRDATGAWHTAELADTAAAISAFGEDQAGELYVADYAGGTVWRLRAEAPASAVTSASQTPPAQRPVGLP